MTGPSITEFLLARIEEDETRSNRELLWGTTTELTGLHARVLAECAAKRAIISGIIPERDPQTGSADYDPLWIIRELAVVYKDHADYQEEWAA